MCVCVCERESVCGERERERERDVSQWKPLRQTKLSFLQCSYIVAVGYVFTKCVEVKMWQLLCVKCLV